MTALAALAVAFLLPTLWAPIVDEHSWRQGWTYMVAYNYAHETLDFLRPQHAWAEDHSGIVGMEPPVYAYLVGLLMRLWGDTPLAGRLVSLLSILAGAWSLAQLLSRHRLRHEMPCLLAVLATSPMVLCESRVVQPDPMALGLCMLAANQLDRAALSRDRKRLWLGAALYLTAFLVKPILIGCGPALFLFANRSSDRRHRRWAMASAALLLLPLALYALWQPWAEYLVATEMGGRSRISIEVEPKQMLRDLQDPKAWGYLLSGLLPNYVLSWVLWPATMLGLGCSLERRRRYLSLRMLAWLLGALVVAGAFSSRYHSNWYYCLPFLPPMVYLTALGLGQVVRCADALFAGRPMQPVQLRRSAFVLLSMALALWLAPSPMNYREALPSVSVWSSWLGSTLLLILLAVTLSAGSSAPRPNRLPRMLRVGLTSIGALGMLFALGLALYSASAWASVRMHRPQWPQLSRAIAQARVALADCSQPQDRVVVTSNNPGLLYRAHRKGYADQLKWVDRRGPAYYAQHGAPLGLHFNDVGPLPTTWRTQQRLRAGPGWALYCFSDCICKPAQ